MKNIIIIGVLIAAPPLVASQTTATTTTTTATVTMVAVSVNSTSPLFSQIYQQLRAHGVSHESAVAQALAWHPPLALPEAKDRKDRKGSSQ